jgi:hypothetical protein
MAKEDEEIRIRILTLSAGCCISVLTNATYNIRGKCFISLYVYLLDNRFNNHIPYIRFKQNGIYSSRQK